MILDRLLSFTGVDPQQWRALVRTSVRTLWRNPASGKGIRGARSSRTLSFVMLLVFYLVLGVIFSVIAWKGAVPAETAALVLIPTSFFVASFILLEFGATVISPDDYAILSVHPVTSRTYFAARMTLVIFLTLLIAGVLNIPACIAVAFRSGLLQSLAWLFASACNALATGMGMVLLYAAALRAIPYRRLMTILGYFQMTMSFLIYGGFGLLSTRMTALIAGTAGHMPWWWNFLPPVWFSSFAAFAEGDWRSGYLILAGCGLVLMVVLIPAAASKLSLSYAESIAHAASVEAPRRPARRGWHVIALLKRSEDRAIAMLVARQFRYDLKFKLTVVSIVPLTALYIYQGLQATTGFLDPFRGGLDIRGMAGSSLLYVAIILFPGILKDEIGSSDNFQASWIFFATPADRVELVLAVKRVLTVYFLVPYLILLGFVFYYFFRNILHVVMHELVILIASQVLFQAMFLISPRLPFSSPRGVGERVTLATFLVLLGPVILLIMLMIFSRYFYTGLIQYATGVVLLLLIAMLVERILRFRISKRVGKMEFAG